MKKTKQIVKPRSKNEHFKVLYRAFDQSHIEIFHKDTPLHQIRSYLYGICHTFLITDIIPTSIKSTVQEDGD
jgi:hypothetical protein